VYSSLTGDHDDGRNAGEEISLLGARGPMPVVRDRRATALNLHSERSRTGWPTATSEWSPAATMSKRVLVPIHPAQRGSRQAKRI
jgi:hypothetical protein